MRGQDQRRIDHRPTPRRIDPIGPRDRHKITKARRVSDYTLRQTDALPPAHGDLIGPDRPLRRDSDVAVFRPGLKRGEGRLAGLIDELRQAVVVPIDPADVLILIAGYENLFTI